MELLSNIKCDKKFEELELENLDKQIDDLNEQLKQISSKIKDLKKKKITLTLVLRHHVKEIEDLMEYCKNVCPIDMIKVDLEYECENGIIGMNRDIVMRLIKLLNKRKIKDMVGIGKQLYKWKSLPIWKWARCYPLPQYENYSLCIFRVSKFGSINLGISKKAMKMMGSILNDMFYLLTTKLLQSSSLTTKKVEETLSSVLSGELLRVACQVTRKCVDLKRGTLGATLLFPPDSIRASLSKYGCVAMEADVPEYVAGVLEYMAAEILELAGGFSDNGMVLSINIMLVLSTDKELGKMTLDMAAVYEKILELPCFFKEIEETFWRGKRNTNSGREKMKKEWENEEEYVQKEEI